MNKIGIAKHYTVYLNKTDKIIAFGTAGACAAAMGITLESFYNASSRCRKGRNRKYTFVVEDLEDAEE